MKADWWFSALLSAGILALTFFIIPSFEFQSVVVRTLAGVFKPFLIILGAVFALIAFFNFVRQSQIRPKASSENYSSYPISNLQAVDPSLNNHQLNQKQIKPNENLQWGYSGFQSNPIGGTPKKSWSLELLHEIEWKLFEDLSAAYYQEKGIRAELTKLGADGGVDIKLFQDDSGRPTSIVQCKAWRSQVGVKPIREFLGVMTHEKISKGFYMTSSSYTQEAKEIAQANKITLIDGKMLFAMIQRLPEDAKQRLLQLATHGDYTTPSCPSCGIKMIKRVGEKGEFWGCANFPRCRQTFKIKHA